MSLVNMQDSIVKASLVTQVQHRAAALARVQQSTQVPFNQELARRADEVVSQTAEAENEGIRENDEESRRHRREQRRRARHTGSDTDTETSGDLDTPADDGGPHHIDITI